MVMDFILMEDISFLVYITSHDRICSVKFLTAYDLDPLGIHNAFDDFGKRKCWKERNNKL